MRKMTHTQLRELLRQGLLPPTSPVSQGRATGVYPFQVDGETVTTDPYCKKPDRAELVAAEHLRDRKVVVGLAISYGLLYLAVQTGCFDPNVVNKLKQIEAQIHPRRPGNGRTGPG